MLPKVFSRITSCILKHKKTGSGKTFTMGGEYRGGTIHDDIKVCFQRLNTSFRSFAQPPAVFHFKSKLIHGHHVKEHKNLHLIPRKIDPFKAKKVTGSKVGFGTFLKRKSFVKITTD